MAEPKMLTDEEKAVRLATAKADLLALPVETLIERLRGLYRTPVNDGAGPLNGSYEFMRQYETGPIQHAAADVIAALIARIAKLEKAGDALAGMQYAPLLRPDGRDRRERIVCHICGKSSPPDEVPAHEHYCPVPAWRAVRENADG